MGLAEWIIDDTCLVTNLSQNKYFTGQEEPPSSFPYVRSSANETGASVGASANGRAPNSQQQRHLTPDYIRAGGSRRSSPQQLYNSDIRSAGGGATNTLNVGQSSIASSSGEVLYS